MIALPQTVLTSTLYGDSVFVVREGERRGAAAGRGPGRGPAQAEGAAGRGRGQAGSSRC